MVAAAEVTDTRHASPWTAAGIPETVPDKEENNHE